jgi:5-methylthioribose kinase
MIELTADNVVAYLQKQSWIAPGAATARPLTGGVSNVVLRVDTTDRVLVVKQSLPKLQTRDAWFSDRARIYREEDVMRLLAPLLPPFAVPDILFHDHEQFVMVMSHAPEPFEVWKTQLLQGRVSAEIARRAGQLLGRMHQGTAGRDDLLVWLGDHQVFVQLRVEPFYERVQQRRPEVARAVAPWIEQLLSIKEAICHGDFTPKNILVHDRGITLVDYETAHYGDPTMDLGMFLSHLLLKAAKRGEESLLEATQSFWEGYEASIRYCPVADLEARAVGHCGVCLLARIDGTSPVDYLTEEPIREAVRRLARTLLLDSPRSWQDVLGLASRAFLPLHKGKPR